MSTSEPTTRRRHELATRIVETLAVHPSVQRAELFGSLASGLADQYSDIDIQVVLRGDLAAFAAQVAELVGTVAPVREHLREVIPRWSVDQFWFVNYPLFWSVDIRYASDEFRGTSELSFTSPSHGFKLWLLAAKRTLRARDTFAMVANVASRPSLRIDAADALRPLLEACRDRLDADGFEDQADIYQECERLCSEF
jgi:predicted nucleotidyltransferase